MDPKIKFFCYLGAAACFALAALGGTRKGRAGEPSVLLAVGLLLWVVPAMWDAGELAF